MLILKYNKFIFYCHNFGSYDFYFIYKILVEYKSSYRSKHNMDYYHLDITVRDETIIRLIIKVVNSDKKNLSLKYISITLLDSLNLLNMGLEKLAINFNVETKKNIFPYAFVNRYNLSYEGPIPDIK